MVASAASHAIALKIDSRLSRLSAVGAIRMGSPVQRLTAGLASAFRRGTDPAEPIRVVGESLKDSIVDAMTAVHLRARLDTAMMAGAAIRKRKGAALMLDLIDDAIEFTARRAKITEKEVDALRAMYSAEAAEVVKGFSREVQQRVADAIAESTREGEHVRDGIKRIKQALASAGVTDARPHLIESIFRTQTQLAYGAGHWNMAQDDAVKEIHTGWEYVTVGDDRVRPAHAALDGFKAPKDAAIWTSIFPPNGWNCRCQAIMLFDHMPAPMVFPVGGGADDGWDFNPGQLFRDTLSRAA